MLDGRLSVYEEEEGRLGGGWTLTRLDDRGGGLGFSGRLYFLVYTTNSACLSILTIRCLDLVLHSRR